MMAFLDEPRHEFSVLLGHRAHLNARQPARYYSCVPRKLHRVEHFSIIAKSEHAQNAPCNVHNHVGTKLSLIELL
jgi:hypothetical protein